MCVFTEKKYFDWKLFMSAILGAVLTLLGAVAYYWFERDQLEHNVAYQAKWEIYENITDSYSDKHLRNQDKTFEMLTSLDPNSSIQNSNFYYLTRHSLRDDFFKASGANLNLLDSPVMKDVLEFYSLLYSVDESEKQMENIFVNKVPLKAEMVQDISSDILENAIRMRTMGAQAVGKIMYYYDDYDLNIRKKDDPNISSEEILNDLYKEVVKYVGDIEKGQRINAYDLAERLLFLNSEVFVCDSLYSDVCLISTAHYLILKTGMVDDSLQVYNGYIKK